MVNYDQEDGVSVSNNKLTSSILTVRNATARHGGNYTCAPANARQSSVYVHVLKGKLDYSFAFPAAKTVCIWHRSFIHPPGTCHLVLQGSFEAIADGMQLDEEFGEVFFSCTVPTRCVCCRSGTNTPGVLDVNPQIASTILRSIRKIGILCLHFVCVFFGQWS